METEDVNTAAWIMMVPILAGVTLATNVGQATSDDVTVRFIYFLLNIMGDKLLLNFGAKFQR